LQRKEAKRMADKPKKEAKAQTKDCGCGCVTDKK